MSVRFREKGALSRLCAFVATAAFALSLAPAAARAQEAPYQIYPTPQEITYGGRFSISDFLGCGIDLVGGLLRPRCRRC